MKKTGAGMKQDRVQRIVDRWVFPTEPGSYMGGLENRPVLEMSRGSIVTDTKGKEYLDFQSGQMGAALGHQHPRIVAAIERALKTMVHASNALLHVPRLRLHETLGKLLPRPLEKSLFLVSGSDSIEAAIDLARKATGGLDIVGLHAGLHGSTSYLTRSISFNWTRRKHAIVAPATASILAPYCYRCPVGLKYPSCKFQCLESGMEASRAGEFHPHALPEPYVNLSAHTAPSIQPLLCTSGQWANNPGDVRMIRASQSRAPLGRCRKRLNWRRAHRMRNASIRRKVGYSADL